YGPHHWLVGFTVAASLIGVVTFGTLAGSLLPFILRRLGFDPASACAPFVATLVDVTGLVIYFTMASRIMRGTLLSARRRLRVPAPCRALPSPARTPPSRRCGVRRARRGSVRAPLWLPAPPPAQWRPAARSPAPPPRRA